MSRTAVAMIIAVLAALATAAQLTTALAQSPDAPPDDGPPRFHRVYVPSEQIQKGTWIEGYLPIDATEFKRLFELAAASASGAPNGRAAHVEQAELSAHVVTDDLLAGSGTFRWTRMSPSPSLVIMEPFNLAVRGATWQDQDSKAATLGALPDGKTAVLIDGSRLQCEWSLRGERTASGAVSFRIELPECPVTRLVLEAPSNREIAADGAVLTKTATASGKTNRWTLEAGGSKRVVLRMTDAAMRERRPLTLLRQSQVYEFSPRGVNVEAQLKFDIHGEPIQQMAVNLDPSLRLVAARYGELQVPWSATIDVESRVSHVMLQLPEAIVGTGRVLQLSAVAPLTTGKRWRLPGLQPEGVSWQEGSATLLIPDSLLLEQLSFEGCRQSRAVPLPAPAAGESIDVQFYRPGASVEVQLTRPRLQLKVESGSLIEVGATEIASQCAIALSSPRGRVRVAETEVNPGWIIDGVEGVKSGRNVEWEFDESAANPRLTIRLDEPATAEFSARVIVRGHRPLPQAPTFEARQFEMLAFDQWTAATKLISVRAAEGTRLRWTGALDLKRLDPLELEPSQLELFPKAPNGLVFAEDSVFGQSSVALDRQKASYTAEIRIDAVVQKDALTETYAIQCTPEAARLERLLVRLSQSRVAPLEWSVAGGNSGQFSARKLSAAEQAQSGLPAGGEAWELSLRLVRSGPFELRAVRTTPLADDTPLALAAVADAASQRGTLTVRALGESAVTITNRRLPPAPAELLEADRYQTARGTYHYQPLRDDVGTEPAISLAKGQPAQAESGAWAWSSRLESRYAASDRTVHWANFLVETAGRGRVGISLPEGAALQGVWIDQQQVPISQETETGLNVELPFGRGLATISLYYTTADGLPRIVAARTPPFAQLDIPVMSRTWSLWLPPDYEARLSGNGLNTDSVAPLSFAERLFGGLGRSERSRIFNPLSRQAWLDLFGGQGELEGARAAAEQFIQNLGNVAVDQLAGEGESQLNWGNLLALCGDAEAKSRRALLIDMDGLAAIGLTPKSRVRFPPGDSPRDRGLGLLKQADLAIICQPSAIVVVSPVTAAAYTRQLIALERPVIFTLAPGPLSNQLTRAMNSGSERYGSVVAWRAAPESSRGPWTLPEARHQTIQEPTTWSAFSWELSPSQTHEIYLTHNSTVTSLSWAVFLAAVAIGVWWGRSATALAIVVASLAAALALWLPEAFAPLASSVFMGALACLLLSAAPSFAPRAPVVSTANPRSSRLRTVAVRSGVIALASLAAMDTCNSLLAAPTNSASEESSSLPTSNQNSTAPSKESATIRNSQSKPDDSTTARKAAVPVYRVLVPVDAQQEAVDGKYYVPKDLFDQLHRQASIASGQPKRWMITRATYQGTLSRDPVTKQMDLGSLKASLDIQVFHGNSPIELQVPHETAADVISGARFEGRPTALRWKDTGVELLTGPIVPGRYRVELALRPAVQIEATTAGFDLPIPASSNAVLTMTIPADMPAIELPAARGQVRVQKERGELSAQLGGCNRLVVRWPTGMPAQSGTSSLEVEEYVWMRVRPGTTILDTKFKYRLAEGRLRQIRLLTDPRLRLLPSINAQSPITAVRTVPGDPQRIELDLARTVSNQVTIELPFLLTGTSSVGNLRLPRLESSDARATKRWLAVSVDPALEFKEQLGEDSRPVTIADFVTAWGPTETRPQSAYSIPRGEPMWILSTQPIEPRTAVEQTVALGFSRDSCQVQLDAGILINGGYLYQLALEAPKELTIDHVTLLEDGHERVSRFTRNEQGRVALFLSAPITGKQRLTLHGRVDGMPRNPTAIPQPKIAGAEIKYNQWLIYRQPDTLLEVESGSNVTTIERPEIDLRDDLGTLVGSYQSADPRATLHVTTHPNTPRTNAIAVTTLEHNADRWTAELECRFEVSDGLVDSLQFEVPPQWSEPYQVDPPARVKVVPIPGEARRQLIVYPAQPVNGVYSLRIRGRVALSPGDRTRVPEILPQRVDELERYVVVPGQLERQPIAWDTAGLTAAELPATLASRHSTASSAFRVSGESFQAAIKAVERPQNARVKLADIRVAWSADGFCRAVAMFDLPSPGSGSCVLELPPECELLHASVENLPAQMTVLASGRWRIALGPRQLPQRLEIVYSLACPQSGRSLRLPAPRLVDLQVETTLWTVYRPQQLRVTSVDPASTAINAVQQSLGRLESTSALMQLPTEIVGEHLPEELLRWYRPWKQRYDLVRAALDWQIAISAQQGAEPNEVAAARRLDQQLDAVDARIGMAPGNASKPASAATPGDLLSFTSRALSPAYYRVSGSSPELELRLSSGGDAWWLRTLAGLVILALGGTAAYAFRTHALPQLPAWGVLAGIGIAWWLLLAPSVIGLAFLAIAIWRAAETRRDVNARVATP
jgi:hypothetical protein